MKVKLGAILKIQLKGADIITFKELVRILADKPQKDQSKTYKTTETGFVKTLDATQQDFVNRMNEWFNSE